MLLHGGHSSGLWTHWVSEPGAVLAIAVSASMYGIGTRTLWRHAGVGHGIRRWQALCFVSGLATLAIALTSPVGALAESLFTAHMIQHVLLAVVAPPLLVAGAPVVGVLWALPADARRRLTVAVRNHRTLVVAWRAVTAPLVACGIHAATLWVWHAPRLYEAALSNAAAHALEHASFVATACLVWWAIIHPRRPRRAGYAIGVAVLFATMMQSGALGALLALSGRVWYPAQTSAPLWGLTPLEDQQLAGLVMWVPAGILYIVAMWVVFRAWLRTSQPTLMCALHHKC